MHCAVDQKLFLDHIKKHSAVKNRVTVIICQKCMYETRQQSFVALVHESIHSNFRKSVMKQNGQPQWAARKAAGKRLHTSNWFHCLQLLCGKKKLYCVHANHLQTWSCLKLFYDRLLRLNNVLYAYLVALTQMLSFFCIFAQTADEESRMSEQKQHKQSPTDQTLLKRSKCNLKSCKERNEPRLRRDNTDMHPVCSRG